jgi:putative tryptophan/tyrosine transport system substrate-binding protein
LFFYPIVPFVEAQQPPKVPHVGYLSPTSPSISPTGVDAFRQGLREVGYIDGKNIVIEYRYAERNFDRLRTLAAELVRLKLDLIVTTGPTVTRAAKRATTWIPIVMTTDTDPIGNGFVASLAHPGGNITGLSSVAPELSGKQLEHFKEILPRLSRVALFGTSTNPGNAQILREVKLTTEVLGVKLQYLDALTYKEIENAFRAASKERVAAVLYHVAGLIGAGQRREITELAVKSRLPTMYQSGLFVEDGGLMSYGVSTADLDRRAATYVDKILKAQSQPICRWSNRPSSSWSST